MSQEFTTIQHILEDDADYLLSHESRTFFREQLHIPGPRLMEQVFSQSDRSKEVIKNLKRLYGAGRLANTGYLSILPVDQAIEHTAGASFAKNPEYFDPGQLAKLAVEAGCSAIASTAGALGIISKKYADSIPFIVKLNHNDLLRYPNDHDQIVFASVEQAYNMGAAGVGATIYFGSPESKRQIQEVSYLFAEAHKLGLFTVLWCYVRNSAFVIGKNDFSESADLTGQANHIGVTIGADIIKQKIPTLNGAYKTLNKKGSVYGKYDERMYTELSSGHPIDMCRYQVAHCYMGRIGLISSGGPSGEHDLKDAVTSAVINKRAGGQGLILGRKAFQRPMAEGIKLLHAVQEVYRCKEIGLA